MFGGTKIKENVDVEKLVGIVEKYDWDDIECSPHAFFRLSEKQRKIFTCFELKKILTKESPFLVGVQYNENYALFYKYKSKYLKMIIRMDGKIKIVTFYFIREWQVPKV